MPAVSKAQRRAFGIAHAIQHREIKPKKGTPSADIAKSAKPSDVEKYAKTPEKGLPQKVKKEVYKRIKEALRPFVKFIKENALPDLKKWWKYTPDQILSTVYWTSRQIPPIDKKKRAETWEDLKKQLQKKYPMKENIIKEQWKHWKPNMPVELVGVRDGKITSDGRGVTYYYNLSDAKKDFPELEPDHDTKNFTGAMTGMVGGRVAIRFETWKAKKLYSTESIIKEIIRPIVRKLVEAETIKKVKKQLSVPEKHQLAIAYKTMRMPDAMIGVMGPPSKAEAREIIKRLTGHDYKPRKNEGVETVLWGVKKGDPDWKEQIITTDQEKFEEARTWAIKNGFHKFRIAKVDMSKNPDFAKTVNKKENTEGNPKYCQGHFYVDIKKLKKDVHPSVASAEKREKKGDETAKLLFKHGWSEQAVINRLKHDGFEEKEAKIIANRNKLVKETINKETRESKQLRNDLSKELKVPIERIRLGIGFAPKELGDGTMIVCGGVGNEYTESVPQADYYSKSFKYEYYFVVHAKMNGSLINILYKSKKIPTPPLIKYMK